MQINRTSGYYIPTGIVPFADIEFGVRVILRRCVVRETEGGSKLLRGEDTAPAEAVIELTTRRGSGDESAVMLFKLHRDAAVLFAEFTECAGHPDKALRHFVLLTHWSVGATQPVLLARVTSTVPVETDDRLNIV
jgi:hypothetical protein